MCVLLFASIHDVIAAEKMVQSLNLWCDMIPIPRELSSDCGMSLEVRPEDAAVIYEQMVATARNCIGSYRRQNGRYEAIRPHGKGGRN